MIYSPPDAGRLASYLADRLPEASDVAVTDVRRSWPGMSRETWFVSAELTEAGVSTDRRFVFRMDPPGGGFGMTRLGYEADVYRVLAPTDVPMQPLLWHEPAGNPWMDGREFFVRGWVDGTVEPDHFGDLDPRYDPLRQQVVKELVEKLAMIHELDWQALGFDKIAHYVPTSVADAAQVEIDWHLDHLLRLDTEPYPAIVEAMLSMRDKLPEPSSRVVIRKENNGVGEEIWQGQRIVAMADWESASLGAPELDLAVAAATTFGYWGVEAALAHYEHVTGTTVNLETFQFYAMMWLMRSMVLLPGGLPGFSSGRDQRLQLASLGLWTVGLQSSLAFWAGF